MLHFRNSERVSVLGQWFGGVDSVDIGEGDFLTDVRAWYEEGGESDDNGDIDSDESYEADASTSEEASDEDESEEGGEGEDEVQEGEDEEEEVEESKESGESEESENDEDEPAVILHKNNSMITGITLSTFKGVKKEVLGLGCEKTHYYDYHAHHPLERMASQSTSPPHGKPAKLTNP